MVVRLRLSMHGTRHNRFFRLVAIEDKKARNAKPIETLGIFDPRVRPGENVKEVQWSVERIRSWLQVGAQPSKRVERMLALAGIWPSPKQTVSPPAPSAPSHGASPSSNAVATST